MTTNDEVSRLPDSALALNQLKNAIAALSKAPMWEKAAVAEAALGAALDCFTALQGEVTELREWLKRGNK